MLRKDFSCLHLFGVIELFCYMFISINVIILQACNQYPLIDQVQPGGIEKSFLLGDLEDPSDDPVFWMQVTLVDVGYGAKEDGLFTATAGGDLSIIRWVIHEDVLVARLVYERIENTDGRGIGSRRVDGEIAGVFRIISHFDIRNRLTETGEELNIREENTTDRAWHLRDNIRVDWSENLHKHAYELDTLAQLGITSAVDYEALAFYEDSPDSPNTMVLEDDYLDVTQKAFAKPKTVDLSPWGGTANVPACLVSPNITGGTAPDGTCNPVELTFRLSFRRVVNSDYEAKEWDGDRALAFGAFVKERFGYDPYYGLSDDQWRRYVARHNIWEQSHFYQDLGNLKEPIVCEGPLGNRDGDQDGTADVCEEAGDGAQCDLFTAKCTLPYRERKTRPIVWYYTDGSSEFLFEATAEAVHEWDAALRMVVATARYAECVRTSSLVGAEAQDTCKSSYPVYSGQQYANQDFVALSFEVDKCRRLAVEDCALLAEEIVQKRKYDPDLIPLALEPEMAVLCHSPVRDDDHPYCDRSVKRVRAGDLRYHQINVIGAPQSSAPWGAENDARDPLTGETIASRVTIWADVTRKWTQELIDKLRFFEGDVTSSIISEATFVDRPTEQSFSSDRLLPLMNKNEYLSRAQSVRGANTSTSIFSANVDLDNFIISNYLSDVFADVTQSSNDQRISLVRQNLASNSSTDLSLSTDSFLSFTSESENISPFVVNPNITSSLQHQLDLSLARKGSCVWHQAGVTAASGDRYLLRLLKEKYPMSNLLEGDDLDLVRDYLIHRIHKMIVMHEIGHSLGLMHNFAASSDAYNYMPQYWQLRTNNGQNRVQCLDVSEDGNRCVGPRWYDPTTSFEGEQLIGGFMRSSVMDYFRSPLLFLHGLGSYDFAALRMIYGDIISVYDVAVTSEFRQAVTRRIDDFGGILGIHWTKNGVDEIHYSQLNQIFNLIDSCEDVDPQAYIPSDWDPDVFGLWNPVLDGSLVGANGYQRCQQLPVDYIFWNQLEAQVGTFECETEICRPALDLLGRVRVPYVSGSDRWADIGNLSVYRNDYGADAFEQVNYWISEEENSHIFDHYRRRKTDFSVRGAYELTLDLFSHKMKNMTKGLGLVLNIYEEISQDIGLSMGDLWSRDIGLLDDSYRHLASHAVASSLVFESFYKDVYSTRNRSSSIRY